MNESQRVPTVLCLGSQIELTVNDIQQLCQKLNTCTSTSHVALDVWIITVEKFEHACFITVWSCYYIVAEFGSFWPFLRLSLHELLAYELLERPR